jgi:hypothetical protein
MGAANRVEGRGGFVFERPKGSAVVDAFGEGKLYAGGDHNVEVGREEGAKKGGRKVGAMGGVLGLESTAVMFAATLAR